MRLLGYQVIRLGNTDIRNCCIALVIAAMLVGCTAEGVDASLFNNTNELEIEGVNASNVQFDHFTVYMIVQLFPDRAMNGVPSAHLSLDWTTTDQQGNEIAVNETSRLFYNATSPGDFYAHAFIDINKNSEYDPGEPYSQWREDGTGELKVIQMREESRWVLHFEF